MSDTPEHCHRGPCNTRLVSRAFQKYSTCMVCGDFLISGRKSQEGGPNTYFKTLPQSLHWKTFKIQGHLFQGSARPCNIFCRNRLQIFWNFCIPRAIFWGETYETGLTRVAVPKSPINLRSEQYVPRGPKTTVGHSSWFEMIWGFFLLANIWLWNALRGFLFSEIAIPLKMEFGHQQPCSLD